MAQAQWTEVNALLSGQEVGRDSRIAPQCLKMAEDQNGPPAQLSDCFRPLSVIE
jgi:hypothetical protein